MVLSSDELIDIKAEINQRQKKINLDLNLKMNWIHLMYVFLLFILSDIIVFI